MVRCISRKCKVWFKWMHYPSPSPQAKIPPASHAVEVKQLRKQCWFKCMHYPSTLPQAKIPPASQAVGVKQLPLGQTSGGQAAATWPARNDAYATCTNAQTSSMDSDSLELGNPVYFELQVLHQGNSVRVPSTRGALRQEAGQVVWETDLPTVVVDGAAGDAMNASDEVTLGHMRHVSSSRTSPQQYSPASPISAGTCVVCQTAFASCLFVPCGHLIACQSCTERVQQAGQTCPMCRADIEKAVRVYTN